MSDRLNELIRRGHGECLEAIRLEKNLDLRIKKLRHYVATRPEGTQVRRARRLLASLLTGGQHA